MNNLESLREKIKKDHQNDKEQLEVIFSDEKKLIIEAPAGSGKTKTLVSKISYILEKEMSFSNKKILALTFGVNAAYKIKKDISFQLQSSNSSNPSMLNRIIMVTNFHGLARHILNLYGYLINQQLQNLDTFEAIDDSKVEFLMQLNVGLNEQDAHWITDFNQKIKDNKINHTIEQESFTKYINYLINNFIPNKKITYNGYLILLFQLFNLQPKLKAFYKNLYTTIIIDEFQDTNILAWEMIQQLIDDNTHLYLFGDSLQRIYGFIGAIDGLMEIASKIYSMEVIKLTKNYRFKDNNDMLLLDKNIRICAESLGTIAPKENAKIQVAYYSNSKYEFEGLINYIKILQKDLPNEKIAILSKTNNQEVKELLENLDKENLDYFYALFNEDDVNYISFHSKAISSFLELLNKKSTNRLSYSLLNKWYNSLKNSYSDPSPLQKSLLKLLNAFLQNLFKEYYFLNEDEKKQYILDVLTSRSLKQSMEYLNEQIIVSTVHGAKGLEWDNIILVGMTDYSFPNYYGLCNICYNAKTQNNNMCKLSLEMISQDFDLSKKFIEELSVFYVAVTRARKKILFVSNKQRYENKSKSYKPCYRSCFLSLPGIESNFLNDFYFVNNKD